MHNRIGTGQVGGTDALEPACPSKADSAFPASGEFLVSVQEAPAPEHLAPQPRVLVGLPENSTRSEIVRTLQDSGRMHVVELDPSRPDCSEPLPPQEVDIALLHAGYLNLNYAALAHDPSFGFPELVFVVDDHCPAQRLALLSRGYRHVISASGLASWLHVQLASLFTLVRARRIVLGACPAQTAVADLTLSTAATRSMNLHLAETNFRETFLRALLTEYGSRRRAAEAAGVPYRSFCEMLRKLCI